MSGKLADVLGVDRVDHADRVALGFHRGLETAAQARDHDFVEHLALLLVLGFCAMPVPVKTGLMSTAPPTMVNSAL